MCSSASSLGTAFGDSLPDSSFSGTVYSGDDGHDGHDGHDFYDENTAHSARLNGPPTRVEGWAPKTNTNTPNEYLQIDLRALYWICSVATQGDIRRGIIDEWTTKYKINLSLDNITWNIFRWNGSEKVNTVKS